MTEFYGKTYCYKNKTIGVCRTLANNVFMVGHIKPSGNYKREKIRLPLSTDAELLQKQLDEFAKVKGLSEVRS